MKEFLTKSCIGLMSGFLLIFVAACAGKRIPAEGVSSPQSVSPIFSTTVIPPENQADEATPTPHQRATPSPTATAAGIASQFVDEFSGPHITVPPLTWTPLPTPSPYPVRDIDTASPLSFTVTTLELPFTAVTEPLVDGQRLFFIGREKPSSDDFALENAIFLHDLQTGKNQLLATSILGDTGVICCMDVSGDWITWLTYLPFGDHWRVRLMNIVTGEKMTLEKEEDTNYHSLAPYLAISGNNVVWDSMVKLEDGSLHSYVRHYDLTTRQMENLAEAVWPESLGYVDVDGDRVVWSKGRLENGQKEADVFLYDLQTRQLTRITNDGYSGQPQINGDYMVWFRGFADIGPIVVYNMRTGECLQLSEQGAFVLLGDDGLLLWHEYLGDYAAVVYDIERHAVDRFGRKSGDYLVPLIHGRQAASEVITDSVDWRKSNGVIEIRTYPASSSSPTEPLISVP